MATERLVVSDLLCYLLYKFGKMPLKELKAVLLPKYVSQGPDNMPSIRMGEGDLNCLLSLIRKLGEKVDGMGVEMDAIMKVVRDLQVQRPVTSLAEARAPLRD